MIERLRCGTCHKLVKYKDYVYLDMINTIIHQRCYTPDFDFKDKGTLEYIMDKYKLF